MSDNINQLDEPMKTTRLYIAVKLYAAAIRAGKIELDLDPDLFPDEAIIHAEALMRAAGVLEEEEEI